MPNPFGLHFDGDTRRIYEVPVNSSFVVDGQGFRIYTPDVLVGANLATSITATDLWSRWVDYHSVNQWAELALDKSGGAFRKFDELGSPIYATFDLRLTNDWAVVPADYKHDFLVVGNIFPNSSSGVDFDTDRITAQGVSPRVQFADSLQIIRTTTGSGLSPAQDAALTRLVNLAEADEELTGSIARLKQRGTNTVLLEKTVTGGVITPVSLTDA
jgi:outer membrane lipoprotein-sorting protein